MGTTRDAEDGDARVIVHEPLAIPIGDAHAFGILIRPEVKGPLTALVLPGAGNFGNGGPPLLTLCRRLATSGSAAMRLDYLGLGESTGGITRLRANAPRATDPHAAVEHLRQLGHANIALVGLCYGGRVAVETAQLVPDLAGLALLAPPLAAKGEMGDSWTFRTLLRRVLRPSRWRNFLQPEHRRTYALIIKRFVRSRLRSPEIPAETRIPDSERPPDPWFVDALEKLATRGVRVLFVAGEVDKCLADLKRPEAQDLYTMLTTPDTGMELAVVPGSVHTFRDQDVVNAVTDIVAEWSQRIASTL